MEMVQHKSKAKDIIESAQLAEKIQEQVDELEIIPPAVMEEAQPEDEEDTDDKPKAPGKRTVGRNPTPKRPMMKSPKATPVRRGRKPKSDEPEEVIEAVEPKEAPKEEMAPAPVKTGPKRGRPQGSVNSKPTVKRRKEEEMNEIYEKINVEFQKLYQKTNEHFIWLNSVNERKFSELNDQIHQLKQVVLPEEKVEKKEKVSENSGLATEQTEKFKSDLMDTAAKVQSQQNQKTLNGLLAMPYGPVQWQTPYSYYNYFNSHLYHSQALLQNAAQYATPTDTGYKVVDQYYGQPKSKKDDKEDEPCEN